MEYAGFWMRFAAAFIDGVLVLGITSLASLAIALAFGLVTQSIWVAILIGYLAFLIGSIVIRWLYFAKMESSPKQATFGKRSLGIKVTDLEGRRISFGRATGRHFAKFISELGYFIGYIMIAFTKKKQGLHDIIAGTLVVKARK